MKRYIALLRGINISGKNKISMAELKTGFAERVTQQFPPILTAAMLLLTVMQRIRGVFLRI